MSETDWIKRHIAPLVKAPGADALRDDVAQLSAIGTMIATMDTIVEGTHFLSSDPLSTVGQKVVRVNVSDIHAKGAKPVEALLSIAWPKGRGELEFSTLIGGLRQDLEAFEIDLIGGDLVGTDGPLSLTMTLTGHCLGDAPIRRSGGRAGQALFINGEIGWGGLGLRAAKDNSAPEKAHRYQVPAISSLMAAQAVVDHATASMDVSDGLLLDAARLAEGSNCGLTLELDRVPLAEDTEIIEEIIEQCVAGDDYLILISADPSAEISGFTRIGSLSATAGMRLTFHDTPVNTPSTLGFEH
ncbi:MAG: thiamine-phosphate kinase [Pseudomonadota bacterium]